MPCFQRVCPILYLHLQRFLRKLRTTPLIRSALRECFEYEPQLEEDAPRTGEPKSDVVLEASLLLSEQGGFLEHTLDKFARHRVATPDFPTLNFRFDENVRALLRQALCMSNATTRKIASSSSPSTQNQTTTLTFSTEADLMSQFFVKNVASPSSMLGSTPSSIKGESPLQSSVFPRKMDKEIEETKTFSLAEFAASRTRISISPAADALALVGEPALYYAMASGCEDINGHSLCSILESLSNTNLETFSTPEPLRFSCLCLCVCYLVLNSRSKGDDEEQRCRAVLRKLFFFPELPPLRQLGLVPATGTTTGQSSSGSALEHNNIKNDHAGVDEPSRSTSRTNTNTRAYEDLLAEVCDRLIVLFEELTFGDTLVGEYLTFFASDAAPSICRRKIEESAVPMLLNRG
ncbi:unnamed protein product [Amoebophrya sp. A25]|nr:unnamed protein product [Amoebophrya sp. A25]|eukprot:GSA25T00018902001.1